VNNIYFTSVVPLQKEEMLSLKENIKSDEKIKQSTSNFAKKLFNFNPLQSTKNIYSWFTQPKTFSVNNVCILGGVALGVALFILGFSAGNHFRRPEENQSNQLIPSSPGSKFDFSNRKCDKPTEYMLDHFKNGQSINTYSIKKLQNVYKEWGYKEWDLFDLVHNPAIVAGEILKDQSKENLRLMECRGNIVLLTEGKDCGGTFREPNKDELQALVDKHCPVIIA
jgi:hypothetical protein